MKRSCLSLKTGKYQKLRWCQSCDSQTNGSARDSGGSQMSWKRAKEWIDNLSSVQNVWSILAAPVVLSGLGAMTDYLHGVPATVIMAAVLMAFAAGAHLLFYGTKYRLLTSVANKLEYMGPFCQPVCTWGDDGHPAHIKTLQIGINLINKAAFPIFYKITSLHITIQGRAADVRQLEGKLLDVGGGTGAASFPNAVDLNDLALLDVKGLLEFEVRYGKSPDDLPQTIREKQEFDFSVRPELSQKPNPNFGISVRDRD